MYVEEIVLRQGGERMVRRWKNKMTGAEKGKWGYDFEDLWAVFHLARLSVAIIEQLRLGKVSPPDDNRINAKRVGCFVDDFDLTRNGFRSFYQLKTGCNFEWGPLNYDFWAQSLMDTRHGIMATYHLVVDSHASRDRAIRYSNERLPAVCAPYNPIVFEAVMDFLPFMALQPRLDEYLAVLSHSLKRDVKRNLFASLLLTCKEPHSIVALDYVLTSFKRTHIRQPALTYVTSGLVRHGFRHSISGSLLRISYNGFSGNFLVPCTGTSLNALHRQLRDPANSAMDIIDWMLARGW